MARSLQSLDPAVAVSEFAPLSAIAREALLRDRMLAALSVALVTLLAGLLPARRAARLGPAVALREE